MKTFKQITEKNHREQIEKCKNSFCTRLKEIREEQKMSQKDVAEKLGCAISTYANWEQGRTEPSIYDIYNLLLVFDIDANELFIGANDWVDLSQVGTGLFYCRHLQQRFVRQYGETLLIRIIRALRSVGLPTLRSVDGRRGGITV